MKPPQRILLAALIAAASALLPLPSPAGEGAREKDVPRRSDEDDSREGLVRNPPAGGKERPARPREPSAPAASAEDSGPTRPSREPGAAGSDRRWGWVLDGVAFFSYDYQGGKRGDEDFESLNHFSLEGTRGLRRGRFGFTGRFSLEPATVSPEGSPQLFQTGGNEGGQPIVDFQYAHDFFTGLEGWWETPLGREGRSVRISAGPAGVAALGPDVYWNRRSSFENPTAPLGHQWFDATYSTGGVVRAEVLVSAFRFEASGFHGAEGDDNRWDLDSGLPDSWSARFAWDPTGPWSGQASYGVLHDHEPDHPGNHHRLIVTASWERDLRRGYLAWTFGWGRNDMPVGISDAFLVEGTLRYRGKNLAYGRLERVETPDLSREAGDTRLFDVVALSLGLERDLPLAPGWDTGLGADFSLYDVPSELEPYYGEAPTSFHFFLRARPSRPGSWGKKGNVEGADRARTGPR